MRNNMITVYTDGATVGQNGKLGTVTQVGIGVYSPDINLSISKLEDGISNNEAEFIALLTGMMDCIRIGEKSVHFKLDSMIVVNRANGKRTKKAKFKNERMDYFQDRVLRLAVFFDEIKFSWIPREENMEADKLSKLACHKTFVDTPDNYFL